MERLIRSHDPFTHQSWLLCLSPQQFEEEHPDHVEAALPPVIRENNESKHHKEPKFISLSLSNLYCTPCSQRHWRQNCIIRRRLVFCNELLESNGSHPTATPCSCHLIFAAWHRAELSPKALPRDLQTVAPWCPAALLLQVTASPAGNAARNSLLLWLTTRCINAKCLWPRSGSVPGAAVSSRRNQLNKKEAQEGLSSSPPTQHCLFHGPA